MTSSLTDFLEAEDLDKLLEIRSSLPTLSEADIDQIENIMRDWRWHQAIANLLMYPELIPEDDRTTALLQGLQAQEVDYYPLAAIVGLENIDPNQFSEELRADIFDNLIACLEHEALIIVQRGTIALSQYKLSHELDRMARWLNYPDDLVKHNILANLITGEGLAETQARLTEVLQGGRLSSFNIPFLQESLREIAECLADSDKTANNLLIHNLTTVKLAYIPNLVEWKSYLDSRRSA